VARAGGTLPLQRRWDKSYPVPYYATAPRPNLSASLTPIENPPKPAQHDKHVYITNAGT